VKRDDEGVASERVPEIGVLFSETAGVVASTFARTEVERLKRVAAEDAETDNACGGRQAVVVDQRERRVSLNLEAVPNRSDGDLIVDFDLHIDADERHKPPDSIATRDIQYPVGERRDRRQRRKERDEHDDWCGSHPHLLCWVASFQNLGFVEVYRFSVL